MLGWLINLEFAGSPAATDFDGIIADLITENVRLTRYIADLEDLGVERPPYASGRLDPAEVARVSTRAMRGVPGRPPRVRV
jgi:hypothetical protein